jgi:hypothetical protein
MSWTKKIYRILRTILKVTGVAALVVVVLISIVSWVVLEKKDNWLLEQIQSFLSESQSGEVQIESVDFKIFRGFPNITLDLNGISYYEKPDTLRTPGEAPILTAEHLFVAIKLLPLMNDELNVSEINISDAHFDIITYKDGGRNIDRALVRPAKPGAAPKIISKQKPPAQARRDSVKQAPKVPAEPLHKASFRLDLEAVSLNDVLLTWRTEGRRDTTVIFINDITAELHHENGNLNISLESASTIKALNINGAPIPPGDVTIKTELRYETKTQRLYIYKGEINNGFLSAAFDGSYSPREHGQLDVNLDASSNDLKLLSMIVRPEVLEKNPGVLKRGDIYVRGRIFGELESGMPQFDIAFGVKDLDLQLPRGLGQFEGIGFDASFESGNRPGLEAAVIEVTKLRGNFPGGNVRGGFRMKNFKDPDVSLDFEAQLALDGYDAVFQVDAIRDLKGKASIKAKFNGALKMFGQHEMDSSRSSEVVLDNVSFVVNKTNKLVSGVSGKMITRNNQAVVSQLVLQYGENQLALDATIDNFVYVLLGREKNIRSSGRLQSQQLFTTDFLFDTARVAHIQDRISNFSFGFDVRTTEPSEDSIPQSPSISFDVRNLKASFDELPDIVRLDARGVFTRFGAGLRLDLDGLNLALPQGKLNVAGHLLAATMREWEFDAQLKTVNFPWVYVSEVVAEISPELDPSAKKLPVQKGNLLTADLDVSAAIITYPFDFRRLEIRKSRLAYIMPDLKLLSAEKVDVSLGDLSFEHPENSGRVTGLKSTRGHIALEDLVVPGIHPVSIKLDVNAASDTLTVDFTSATQEAKYERGRLSVDMSQHKFAYDLKYEVQGLNLEPYVKKFYKKKLLSGLLDYKLDLSTSGLAWSEVKKSLKGIVEVNGDSLLLYGVDVDKILKKYEKTQNFNLTDVGALLIAGPVGLLVTKGADFASLASVNHNDSQQTRIQTIHTQWTIADLKLQTRDVAFTTPQNRIAFDGVIDLAHDSIPGLTIAVLDKNGCALMDQRIYGKTNAIKAGKLNVAKTMLGSVVNFVHAVVGKDCVPVYTGSVAPPL